jgi:hypothetical protein
MPETRQYRMTIDRLKKKIKSLEQKEAASRKKVKQAVASAKSVAKVCKKEFEKKVRDLKNSHALDKAAACAKSALHAERKVMKDVEKLCKEMTAAIVKMDKKHLSRVVKGFMKKATKSTTAKKAKSKARKAAPKKVRKIAKMKRKVSAARKAKKS